MGRLVAECLWLAGPVALTGVLHMGVVKRGLFPRLAVALDGGRTLGGAPIFGPNKTWRGVVFMTGGAALAGLVQGALFGAWAAREDLWPVDPARAPLVGAAGGLAAGYALVNAALGAGYVLGELPNSFLKRRLAIAPGRTGAGLGGAFFFLLDQADSVVAALALGALLFGIRWEIVLAGSVVLTLVHLALNAALYLARVRRNL